MMTYLGFLKCATDDDIKLEKIRNVNFGEDIIVRS